MKMTRLRAIFNQQNHNMQQAAAAAYQSRDIAANKLLPFLRDLTKELISNIDETYYTFSTFSQRSPSVTFCFAAHINSKSPAKPKEAIPAQLVFSAHLNGAISVSLYPHESSSSKFGRDEVYVVGHYESASDLLTLCGKEKIQEHFELFMLVMTESDPRKQPSPASQRLISRLEKQTSEFEAAFGSRKEHKATIVSAEIGLGMGLMGGLIASTLFPMLVEAGKAAPRDSIGSYIFSVDAVFSYALLLFVFTGWKMKRLLRL